MISGTEIFFLDQLKSNTTDSPAPSSSSLRPAQSIHVLLGKEGTGHNEKHCPLSIVATEFYKSNVIIPTKGIIMRI